MSIRIVQCQHSNGNRIVAIVEGENLRPVNDGATLYEFVREAIQRRKPLEELLRIGASDTLINYESVYSGNGPWSLLPPFDHPADSAHCLVTGTGLSHRKSADNRNAMHSDDKTGSGVTDSMRMYQLGESGGRPAPGEIGTPPEWFWKGDGDILRAQGEPLITPNFAEDGGDEAEIAGTYLISDEGEVYRVGFAAANEFSDHVTESRNYLYLAPSKLRQCSLGPELVIGGEFDDISGSTAILRNGNVIWSQEIRTGEANMVHSLANLEHHHFKYDQHRRAGDVHIHCFGTPGFSFGSGLKLLDGDVMSVHFDGFGRALSNPIRIDRTPILRVEVRSM